MKIIQAHKYYYQRAGAERVMLGLSRMLTDAGHEVAPFAMRYPKNLKTPWSKYFVSELSTEGGVGGPITAFKMLRRAWWSSEAESKMSQLIKVFRPDVLHAHNLYTHLSPSILRAAAQADVPVVMTLHDYALLCANYALWNFDKPMDLEKINVWLTAKTRFIKGSYFATLALDLIRAWQTQTRAYDRYIAHYIAPTEFVRDLFVAGGFEKKKISVFPIFSDAPAQTKTADDGFVLFAGRLERYKGVETLIEALRNFPNTTLKIIGSGPDEARLRTLAEGMGNVVFTGQMSGEALWEQMRRARVAVVPSIWHEPFGLVALEAMSNSTPVVVSDRGGLQEILQEGVSGSVFHAGDVHDLVRALAPYLAGPYFSLERGQAAYHRALEIGDQGRYLQRVLKIYHQIQAVDK
jgi:glycosyltransferase involved in cell wall biosynthesis